MIGTKKLRYVLIDDERAARQRLFKLLEVYQELECCGEAKDGAEGLVLIEQEKPDLIFLDISMPIMSAFDLLKKMKHQAFVIFTTAYEEYALKAFEHRSVDYLLKPIESTRLEKTMEKVNALGISASKIDLNFLQELSQNIEKKRKLSSFTVKTGPRIQIVVTDHIRYFQATDKYVTAYAEDGKSYLTNFTIKELEESLDQQFLRIQRGLIVNTNDVIELIRYDQGRFQFCFKDKKLQLLSGAAYLKSIKTFYQMD